MSKPLFLCAALLIFTGCSSEDKDGGADIIPDDSEVDAGVDNCPLTECGDECVDTSSDPMHCGGCGMACNSAAQTCTGALPCLRMRGTVGEMPTSVASWA